MPAAGINERDLAEERVLLRRRLRLAFLRGSRRGSLLDQPRPNRALAGGVGVTVLATLGAGIAGIVRDDPPEGWNRDGAVVVAEESGTRYLIDDGRRRPVINDTSLRLALGASPPTPVTVEQDVLRALPEGEPLGREGWPFFPPALLENGAVPSVCVRGDEQAVLLGGDTAVGGAAAVLVRGRGAVWLVAEGRRFRLATRSVQRLLGYGRARALPVPNGWLDVVRVGVTLRQVQLPRSTRRERARPPFLRSRTLVSERGSGRLYVASGGALRPVANRTALQLVYGTSVPRPRPVRRGVVRTQRIGTPIGSARMPAAPPQLAATRDRWVCGHRRGARALEQLPVAGLDRTEGRIADDHAVVWQPDGSAALVGVSRASAEPTEEHPAYLVSEGRAFPVTGTDVLGALGYDGERLQVIRPSLLKLLPPGPQLARIDLDADDGG